MIIRSLTLSAIAFVVGFVWLASGTPAATEPKPSVYLSTLNASLNPSGLVMINREVIGPLLPEVAAGYDIKVMFTKPVPGNTVLCRVTSTGAVCTTLDKALPVPQ